MANIFDKYKNISDIINDNSSEKKSNNTSNQKKSSKSGDAFSVYDLQNPYQNSSSASETKKQDVGIEGSSFGVGESSVSLEDLNVDKDASPQKKVDLDFEDFKVDVSKQEEIGGDISEKFNNIESIISKYRPKTSETTIPFLRDVETDKEADSKKKTDTDFKDFKVEDSEQKEAEQDASSRFSNIGDIVEKYKPKTSETTASSLEEKEGVIDKIKDTAKKGLDTTGDILDASMKAKRENAEKIMEDTKEFRGWAGLLLGETEAPSKEEFGENLLDVVTLEKGVEEYPSLKDPTSISTPGLSALRNPELAKETISDVINVGGDVFSAGIDFLIPDEKQKEMSEEGKKIYAEESEMTEEEREKIEDVSVGGELKDLMKDPAQILPAVADIRNIYESIPVLISSKNIEEGDYSEADRKILENYFDKQELEREAQEKATIGGKGLQILKGSIPFMTEIYLTRGISSMGKKAIMQSGKEALENITQKGGKEYLERLGRKKTGQVAGKVAEGSGRAVAAIGGEIARLPVAGSVRIPSGALQKMLPKGVEYTEDDLGELEITITKEGDNAYEAFRNATGETFVEYLSEQAGGAIPWGSRAAKELFPEQIDSLMKASLAKRFFELNPNVKVKKFNDIAKKAGFHGIIGEMGEERIADVGHAFLDKYDLGGQPFKLPSKEDLASEFIAFSIPASITKGADKALEVSDKRRTKKILEENRVLNSFKQAQSSEEREQSIQEMEKYNKKIADLMRKGRFDKKKTDETERVSPERAKETTKESEALVKEIEQAENSDQFKINIQQKADNIASQYKGNSRVGTTENIDIVKREVNKNPEITRVSQSVLESDDTNKDGYVTAFKGVSLEEDAKASEGGWTLDMETAQNSAIQNDGQIVAASIPIEDVAFYDSPVLRENKRAAGREVILKDNKKVEVKDSVKMSDISEGGDRVGNFERRAREKFKGMEEDVRNEISLSDIYNTRDTEREIARERRDVSRRKAKEEMFPEEQIIDREDESQTEREDTLQFNRRRKRDENITSSNLNIEAKNSYKFNNGSVSLINRVARALNTNVYIDEKAFENRLEETGYQQVETFANKSFQVYAFTDGADIYINPNYFDDSTLLHEGAHLWWRLIKRQNPTFYERAKDTIRDSEYYTRVEKDRPDVTSDALKIDEALAMAVEEYGDINRRKSMTQDIIDIVRDMWRRLLNFFGVENKALDLHPEILSEASISDLSDIVYSQLTGGVILNKAVSQTAYGSLINRMEPFEEGEGQVEAEDLSTPEDPLIQEALKHNSVEEFIKNTKEFIAEEHYWNRSKKIVDDYIESNPNSVAAKEFKREARDGDYDRAYARALSPDAGNIFSELPKDLQDAWALKKAFDQETGETLSIVEHDTLRGTHIFNARDEAEDLYNREDLRNIWQQAQKGTQLRFSGKTFTLTKKGEKLGLENRWEELTWKGYPKIKSESGGDVNKFREIVNDRLNNLYQEIENGEHIIQFLSRRSLEQERDIARENGQSEVAEQAQRILDGDTELEQQVLDKKKSSQQASINTWINYLKQAHHLDNSFKYHLLKQLINKAKVGKQIKNRRKDTMSDFIPLNPAVLADWYENGYTPGLYKEYLDMAKKKAAEQREGEKIRKGVTEGEWVKFPQNSAPEPLANSVQETDWCIGTIGTAKGYLEQGDFYVFYTKDTEGSYTVPRIAIATKDGEVSEIKGVLDGPKQNLEPEMSDIAYEKSHTLPGAEEYDKKFSDMKKLTEIEKKHTNNEELTAEELRFLYELESEIEGFGLDRDSRINEIKDERNVKKDYGKILDISEEKVITQEEAENFYREEEGNPFDGKEVFIGDIRRGFMVTIQNIPGRADQETLDLGDLKYIMGEFRPPEDSIKDLKKLEYVHRGADLGDSKIKSLKNLRYVGGGLAIDGSNIKDLGALKTIGREFRIGSAATPPAPIKSLQNIEYIGGRININDSNITDLGALKEVGLLQANKGSKIKNLGKLKVVNDTLNIAENEKIKSLGELEYVDALIIDNNKGLQDFGELKELGRLKAQAVGPQLKSLGSIEKIKGEADIRSSKLKDLGNLKEVEGDFRLENTDIKSLEGVQRIGRDIDFSDTNIEDLGELKEIGRVALFNDSKIENLKNLQKIGSNAFFTDSKIKDIGALNYIGENATFNDSLITDLKNLNYIGGEANFGNANIKSLKNVEYIGGVNFEETNIEDLGALKEIGGRAVFENSKITNLKNLKVIGGTANLNDSNVKDLGALEHIKENAVFIDFKIDSLKNLKTIGGFAHFEEAEIQDLGALEEIQSSVLFTNAKIKSLNNLKVINGYADLRNSEIEDLGKLKQINGYFNIENTNITSLGNLERVEGQLFLNDKIETIDSLISIGNLNLEESGNSNLKSLGSLKYISTDLNVGENSSLQDLGDLKIVNKKIDLNGSSKLKSLNNLEFTKELFLNNSNVTDLGKISGRSKTGEQATVYIEKDSSLEEELRQRNFDIKYVNKDGSIIEEEKQKKTEEELEPNITTQDAESILSNIFPENEVKFLTTDLLGYTEEGTIYGRYANAFIEVVENGGKVSDKVVYHEAFHAYADIFMTNKEKQDIRKELKKRKGEEVNENNWEEILADEFANYAAGERTFSERLNDFFRKITRMVRKFIEERPRMEDMFDDILGGEAMLRQGREPSQEQKNKVAFRMLSSLRNREVDDYNYDGEINLPPEGQNDSSAISDSGYSQSDISGFTKWEKFKNGTYWTTFRQKVEDSNIMLKQLGKEIKEAAGGNLKEHEDIWRQKDMLPRKISDVFRRSRDRKRKMIEDLMKDDLTVDEVNSYVRAKHAEERNEAMKEYRAEDPEKRGEPKDGLSGMTTEEANEILNKAKEDGKEEMLEKYAEEIYSILDEALYSEVDNGLISQESYDAIKEKYDYYVPLFRDIDEEAWTGIGSGTDIKGVEEHQAKGSEKPVIPPIAGAFYKLERAQIRALKNEIGKNIIKMTEEHDFLKDVFDVGKQKYIPKFGEDGELVHLDPAPIDKNKNIIGAKIDGKQYFITVYDESVYKALKDMNIVKAYPGMKTLSTIVRLFSVLKTKWSPEFIITNFERDLSEAIINLGVESEMLGKEERKKLRRSIIKDVFKSQKEIYKYLRGKESNETVDEFFRLGGDVGRMWGEDLTNAQDSLYKIEKEIEGDGVYKAINAWKATEAFVDNIQSTVELGVRYATYKQLIARGFSKDNAVQSAADLTINFSRQGEYGPFMKSIWAFVNPAIQGTSKVTRATTSSVGRKKMLQSITGLIALGYVTRSISIMMSGDDDQKIPDWQKNHKLTFNIGDKNYTLWSMPYGYATFFSIGGNLAEVSYNHKKETEAAKSVLTTAADSFSPFGTQLSDALPTLFKPVWEINTNENWYDAKIYPEQIFTNTPKPDHEVYFDSTSEAPIKIAETIYQLGGPDVHPESLQYLFDQYFGGPFDFISSSIVATTETAKGEFDPTNVPYLRKHYRKVNDNTVYDFVFDTLNKARKENVGEFEEARFMWALEDGAKNEVFDLAKAKEYEEEYFKARAEKVFEEIEDSSAEEKRKTYNRVEEKDEEGKMSKHLLNLMRDQKAKEIYEEMKGMTLQENRRRFNRIQRTDKYIADKIRELYKEDRLSDEERTIKKLKINNGDRAERIYRKLRTLKSSEERREMKQEYVQKGLITNEVSKQLLELEQNRGY